MNTPAVSVLMPVYNAVRYLDESVDSFLKQSFSDFELLAIDDGSTDDTVACLKSRGDPRIRIERMSENGGIVAALNRGLALSRGKYIARMDADDIAEPNRLKIQTDFLDAHPEVGVCGSDFLQFSSSISPSWIRYFDHEDVAISLLFENPLCHPTVMIRRALFGPDGYPSDYPHAEEYALWVEFALRSRLVNLPEQLLRYRVHAGQVSRQKSVEQCASMDRLIRVQLATLGLSPSGHELRLHKTLGSAFMPMIGLNRALRHWIDRLIAANDRTRIYPAERFRAQLEQRLVDTVGRTNRMLASMPLKRRLGWQARSWFRVLQ